MRRSFAISHFLFARHLWIFRLNVPLGLAKSVRPGLDFFIVRSAVDRSDRRPLAWSFWRGCSTACSCNLLRRMAPKKRRRASAASTLGSAGKRVALGPGNGIPETIPFVGHCHHWNTCADTCVYYHFFDRQWRKIFYSKSIHRYWKLNHPPGLTFSKFSIRRYERVKISLPVSLTRKSCWKMLPRGLKQKMKEHTLCRVRRGAERFQRQLRRAATIQ